MTVRVQKDSVKKGRSKGYLRLPDGSASQVQVDLLYLHMPHVIMRSKAQDRGFSGSPFLFGVATAMDLTGSWLNPRPRFHGLGSLATDAIALFTDQAAIRQDVARVLNHLNLNSIPEKASSHGLAHQLTLHY